jgi:hypothetical protein
MANLVEIDQWDAGIYQLETADPVEGGVNGVDNKQAKSLANRTLYLKNLIAGLSAGKQPLDDTLTAIAALVTAADKLIYATGADAFATTTLTAFARTLLDDVDAATMRTTLGLGSIATLTVDTDNTLAANSDTRVATQKAIKEYADALIAANDAMVFKGVINCSANPNYPAADRGHTYRVSVAGKIGGAAGVNVEAGDILLCQTDGTVAGNQATVGANWCVIQANLDGALLSTAIGNTVQGYDATLTALAAIVTAADKLIYATGVDTFATTTLTAFARTLLDDIDAATMRTTLGIADGSTAVKGILQLATSAEAQALTDALKAITPATLAAALQGVNQSLATSGYQKLPGGLILQWGAVSFSSGSSSTTISGTFPITFPSACKSFSAVQFNGAAGGFLYFSGNALSTSGFSGNIVERGNYAFNAGSMYYVAIGY